jgi:4-hydroxy-3-methylbut-2-enyl diphosphate reductase
MDLVRIKPSGYCFGVVNAINIVLKALKSDVPKPITIYGMLIHNKKVIDSLTHLGVNTLLEPSINDLSSIKGTVIFTAHGIKKSTKDKAQELGLHVIDATCRDVTKTFDIIDDFVEKGYEVLYIGKKGHPEATAATDNPKVHLISDISDLDIDISKKYVITNQTTMSMLDVFDIYEYIRDNYTNVEIMEEICNATRRRQEAVLDQLDKELLIVVGDTKSNNSNNLAKLHPNGVLVETYRDLEGVNLNVDSIAVTAGASTPKQLVEDVMEYLRLYPNVDKFESKEDYLSIVKPK